MTYDKVNQARLKAIIRDFGEF